MTVRARPRARLSKQRGFLEAVLSSADRRLTLRAATPRIYSISLLSLVSFRSFLLPLSLSFYPLLALFAHPLRHSLLFLSRARLSSRRRHANSRDARNIKLWRLIRWICAWLTRGKLCVSAICRSAIFFFPRFSASRPSLFNTSFLSRIINTRARYIIGMTVDNISLLFHLARVDTCVNACHCSLSQTGTLLAIVCSELNSTYSITFALMWPAAIKNYRFHLLHSM